MTSTESLRNIGIVAHVDAGKTTLAEQMLYLSGNIRSLGRVDDGTTQLDWLSVERRRGITVLAATTLLSWRDCHINLIDTPGHVDFSSETSRALRILDAVIVVVSGTEGVQAHTKTLWRAIQSLGIPTLFFVNKMDRDGADETRVLKEIRDDLTPNAVLLQRACRDGHRFVNTRPVLSDEMQTDPLLSELVETLAEHDEAVVERFVQEEKMPTSWLEDRLRFHARSGRIYPVLVGTALHGIGPRSVLDAVVDFFPSPKIPMSDELSAVVFKIQREPRMGRMAFVRLYSGSLTSRQLVPNTTQGTSEKISQIRKISANAHQDVGQVGTGDIAALCGLEQTRIGDVLGNPEHIPEMPEMPVPVFQVKAFPLPYQQSEHVFIEDTAGVEEQAKPPEYVALAEAMLELEDEDPSLAVDWNADIRELRVRVMGVVQVEILQSILHDRFGLFAGFGKPSVIFKETPAQSGHGYIAYTSIPHWAVMHFLFEPAERGSGLAYKSIVRPGELKIRYQREIARRVSPALEQGPKGWEVTDLKVTLIEGSDHEQHTHPLDFVAATGWAVEDALKNCGTVLLEPILAFRIEAPPEAGGRICNELYNRRASFDEPVFNPDLFTLEGEIPASTSLDLPIQLQQWSSGKAMITTRLCRYALAPASYNDDPANFQAKREGISFKAYM